ncbi:P-loop containing NTP hydrolase pore-1-domain-containing protein [Pelagophyceae sp. CCMP2097]|nr:P-loop containing NTP hydrolase pore-1-domain-containing protein [Pelagophyceae sp. CCMP2097]
MDAAAARVLARAGSPPNSNLHQAVRDLLVKEARSGKTSDQAEAAVLAILVPKSEQKSAKASKAARGEDDENAVEEEIEAEVFAHYRCGLSATFACGKQPLPHPGDIAESNLLASVPMPRLTYDTQALDGCADRGTLSELQLEGVLHACQRHTVLTGGVRSGFFLGDGAGVGKGRQIAAIVLDNVARGRGKHVWFSIASDLRLDAERDLGDVGCHVGVVDGCNSLDALSKLAFGGAAAKRGVLFSTYSTLISTLSSKGPRLEQLVNWCGGPAFEGCIIFDEAHKAKNYNATNAEASTKVSAAVIALQDQLPRARIVYASATGVTEITNMAYATRLGLWGAGTAFETFKGFAETMEKRGVGALEMLALELKVSGAYVSRGLSWQKCEFDHLKCALPSDRRAMYDRLAAWWRALRRALGHALKVANMAKGGPVWQRFWGTQLRFFKEVQTSCKVPFVVAEAKAALAAGQCVVIGLQSTGEAGLDAVMREMGKQPGDTVKDFVAAAKVAARQYVLQFFPIAEEKALVPVPDDDVLARLLQVDRRPPPTSADVARHRRFLEQANAAPQREVEELVLLRADCLAALEALDVPCSPLDALVDAFGGPSAVAEMTGRSARIVRVDGRLRYEARLATDKDQSLNVRERKAFMAGKKRVAIISDAASTGISLHAAVGAPSENLRRVHITLELAWSADKSIQQLGRSHRANERSAPLYKLVTTDLAGESRFGAAVAKRLSSLGALTKGDRRAASGQDMSDFEVDTYHGRQALTKLSEACNNRFENKVAYGLDAQAPANAALYAALDSALEEHKAAPRRPSDSDFVARFATGADDVDDAGGASMDDHLAGDDATSVALRLVVLAKKAYSELDVDPKKGGDVRTFLNRLQSLSVSGQALLFEYFSACHRAVIADARANGTLDAGVTDLRAASAVVESQEVVGVDAVSGAETNLYAVTLDRGVSFAQACEKLAAAKQHDEDQASSSDLRDASPAAKKRRSTASAEAFRGTGFYVSRRPLPSTRSHGILLAVQKANNRSSYVVTRPNTGTSPFEMPRNELHEKYAAHTASWQLDETADAESALAAAGPSALWAAGQKALEEAWTAQYTAADSTARGSRRFQIGLVSGAVLPFWRALERTVIEYRDEMSRAEQGLKVCRVILDDGTKLVGIRFPKAVLGPLKANLASAHELRAEHARSAVSAELPTPVDAAALRVASTRPRTITSFFKAAAAPAVPFSAPAAPADAPAAPGGKPAPVRRQRSSGGSASSASASSKPASSSASKRSAPSIAGFFGAPKPPAGAAAAAVAAGRPPPVEFSICPCCEDLVETTRINDHLDNHCKAAKD